MNQFITTDLVSNTALAMFANNCPFIMTASRIYQPEFSNTGYKIGDTIRLRKQNHFIVGNGAVASPQDILEDVESLVISNQYNTLVTYTVKDLTLRMEDFSRIFLQPAIQEIITQMEKDINLQAEQQLNFFTGTAGTPIQSYNTVDLAGAKLLEQGVNIASDAYLATTVRDGSALKSGLLNNFTPVFNEDIVRSSAIGHLSYFDIFQSQNINKHVAGAGQVLNDPLQVAAAVGSGNVITLKGATHNVTNYFLPGDLISISGVNSVNPVGRKDTGQNMQWVVTAAANSDNSGNISITVSPTIISDLNNPRRNVTNAVPLNATVTFIASYNVNVAYTARSLDIVCPPLYKLEVPYCSIATDEETGLSLAVTQIGDITSYQNYMRIDVLNGFKWHPEYAVKVLS